MFVVPNYTVAVLFCLITMFCWGSWANTQKLAGKRWRFELFYWDYVFGVLLMAIFFAFTLGSMGQHPRGFAADVRQADLVNIFSAFLGGIVFNAANVLLVAAIAISGMSVAFPVGIGLALIVGVLINYLAQPIGSATLLFLGVVFVTAAIVLDAIAYRKIPGQSKSGGSKGLVLSVICGFLMGTFYFCVASAMPKKLEALNLQPGKLGPYAAMVFFSLGVVAGHFLSNLSLMINWVTGTELKRPEYLQGAARDHLWGILGGCIWSVGMMFNLIASEKGGFAVSYGLGQGATMVAALWGVFIWREFRDASLQTKRLLIAMFVAFAIGLLSIVISHDIGSKGEEATTALLELRRLCFRA
jgi:glucose uptake protein